ncbi:DUF4474 domain-containing protein [Dehalobacter sp. DCM]|uniref:DUF4474 domain-containing protein n=1 Tax=Dehalobacter sp. DCM TaxID=2907827 RepID=UPI003081318D|nr:DUF4474 domain-containing protein [Dehalobacter sp. DCM]
MSNEIETDTNSNYFSIENTPGIGNEELDEIIEIAGYSYDPTQDIFISNMRPWQRWIGYCRLFDIAAAPMGMIIDCEPIRFDYQGKQWMIGIWKGQYDLVCGGEIGFYQSVVSSSMSPIPSTIFYRAVKDTDMLEMSYTLKRNGEHLFTRSGKHWWLTGFKLGSFAQPSELTMDIRIQLRDLNMLNAFLAGMRAAGYNDNELFVMGNTVSFCFNQPRTPQPFTRTRPTDWLIQQKNKFLCQKFNELTGDKLTVQEKITLIEEKAPWLLKRLDKMNPTSISKETWVLIAIAFLVTVYLVYISSDKEFPDSILDEWSDNLTGNSTDNQTDNLMDNLTETNS